MAWSLCLQQLLLAAHFAVGVGGRLRQACSWWIGHLRFVASSQPQVRVRPFCCWDMDGEVDIARAEARRTRFLASPGACDGLTRSLSPDQGSFSGDSLADRRARRFAVRLGMEEDGQGHLGPIPLQQPSDHAKARASASGGLEEKPTAPSRSTGPASSPYELEEEPTGFGLDDCGCDDCTCIDAPEHGADDGTEVSAPRAPPPATRSNPATEYRRGSYLQAAARALTRHQVKDSPRASTSAEETSSGSSSEERGLPSSSCSASDKAAGQPGAPGWAPWTCKGRMSCGYRHNHPMSASCVACGRFWTGRKKGRKSAGGSPTGSGLIGASAVHGSMAFGSAMQRAKSPLNEVHWSVLKGGKGKGHGVASGHSSSSNAKHFDKAEKAPLVSSKPPSSWVPSTPDRVDMLQNASGPGSSARSRSKQSGEAEGALASDTPAATRVSLTTKAENIDFDVDDQLARCRGRCQQKLRELVDAENYQSQLEQQTRDLRQQMMATAKHVAGIRHRYNEDLTVIESLSEYRRLQWRRAVEAGSMVNGRPTHESAPPSRTRSPMRADSRLEGKGSRQATREDISGRIDHEGDTRRNGWGPGF